MPYCTRRLKLNAAVTGHACCRRCSRAGWPMVSLARGSSLTAQCRHGMSAPCLYTPCRTPLRWFPVRQLQRLGSAAQPAHAALPLPPPPAAAQRRRRLLLRQQSPASHTCCLAAVQSIPAWKGGNHHDLLSHLLRVDRQQAWHFVDVVSPKDQRAPGQMPRQC